MDGNEGRESFIGLETQVTATLSLVLISYKILELVWFQSCLGGKIGGSLVLVSFVSISLRLVGVWF